MYVASTILVVTATSNRSPDTSDTKRPTVPDTALSADDAAGSPLSLPT